MQQGARAFGEFKAIDQFVFGLGRVSAHHIADVHLGDLVIAQIDHVVIPLPQLAKQPRLFREALFKLYAGKDAGLMLIAIAIIEFGDQSRAEVMAQALEAAGSFGDVDREQGLAILAQRGQLRDMAQAVKIDIGAAEDGDQLPPADPLALHILLEAGQGQRARRLRDGAGVFKNILYRRADLIHADQQDLIHQHLREAVILRARLPDRRAIGKDADLVQPHPPAGLKRAPHAGRFVRLHADDFYLREMRLDVNRDAGDQAAAAHGHKDDIRVSGRILRHQLDAHRGLAGDDQRMIIGRDKAEVARFGQIERMVFGVIVGRAVQDDLGPHAPDRADFDLRRGLRHDDAGLDRESLRGQRHALRVIAGRGRDHAAFPRPGRERGQHVIGAAQFVGKDRMLVFAFQPDFVLITAGKLSRIIKISALRDLINPPPGLFD